MKIRLFPKEEDFFKLFDKVAANITHAATLLVALMETFKTVDAWAKEMHELEQEGDVFTHDIIRKLNKTFITPIDREDIHALATTLDDILDLIWAAVDRLTVFKTKRTNPLGDYHV
jgi:uncharacterized protein Yka (UPF0111/DUF47 family)